MPGASAGEQLAAEVRRLIAESELPQRQIAAATGIPQSVLSKFLKGSSMRIETLGGLLSYLGMEIRPSDDGPSGGEPSSDEPERVLPGLAGLEGAFSTVLADPPWRFRNRTGKMAPEHRRLRRYATMSIGEIKGLPVARYCQSPAHLYLWCPNALLREGLEVMEAWGFAYKTNLVWYKTRKDGGPDGRGVGFYFRNVTEALLFGVRGHMRTLAPGRRQVNIILARKREHSRKPSAAYEIIEQCSPGPYLELFARERVDGWTCWGDEVDSYQATLPLFGGCSTRLVCAQKARRARRA